MANVVTVNPMIAREYFFNSALYKPTSIKNIRYKLYIPEYNKAISNPYTCTCEKTNFTKPAVVEGYERDFKCLRIDTIASLFTFADGTPINSNTLTARYKNADQIGKVALEPKSGNNYLALKPEESFLNTRCIAVHVPLDISFTLYDEDCVNDKRVKNHGKHGDYIVRMITPNGPTKALVINGAVFEHSFVLTSLNEAAVVAADKKAIGALSDRYSY